MPIAKPGQQGGRQLLMLGAASLLGIVAMVWLMTQFADAGTNTEINIGDAVFPVGHVERLSEDIEDKGPLLFSDVSGGDRDIFLQHVGDDEMTGWSAFGVRQLDAVRDCYVEWEADRDEFVDNCDATTYPADGTGLPQYPVNVDSDGNLSVDVRAAITGTPTEPSSD